MRKKRVRVHYRDQNLPSVEGLLVSKGRYGREVMIRVPRLLVAPQANPSELEAKLFVIPREALMGWEEL